MISLSFQSPTFFKSKLISWEVEILRTVLDLFKISALSLETLNGYNSIVEVCLASNSQFTNMTGNTPILLKNSRSNPEGAGNVFRVSEQITKHSMFSTPFDKAVVIATRSAVISYGSFSRKETLHPL